MAFVTRAPRVAFFTDSFHEVNGVALTSRQFDAFARRRQIPFLSVHAGPRTRLTKEDSIWSYELSRGPGSISLDRNLFLDPFLARHLAKVAGIVRDFRAEVIHVTGPGDFGMLGAWLAHSLKIPLAASWHTNVHEFASRRLEKLLNFLPGWLPIALSQTTDQCGLKAMLCFYRKAQICFAPNPELIDLVQRGTGIRTLLMQRGVDTRLFSPEKRCRDGGPFTLGFVGRLQPEKNVRFLADLEHALLLAGCGDFRFLVLGEGGERRWLLDNLKNGDFPGVLTGEALARAYADMDVFVFPSFTDTFGNVILEAMASGLPVVVTSGGGPKFLVKSGVTGFIAIDNASFIQCVLRLMIDSDLHERLRVAARQYAMSLSWDDTFERVYDAYSALRAKSSVALRRVS